MSGPVTDLRAAATALTAEPTSTLHRQVGAWLDSVADRMVLGGWVAPAERNRALKVARAVDRCSATTAERQRCTRPATDPHWELDGHTMHTIHDPDVLCLVREHFTEPPQS